MKVCSEVWEFSQVLLFPATIKLPIPAQVKRARPPALISTVQLFQVMFPSLHHSKAMKWRLFQNVYLCASRAGGNQSTMRTDAAAAPLWAIYNQLCLMAFAVAAAVRVIFSPTAGNHRDVCRKCDWEQGGIIEAGRLNRFGTTDTFTAFSARKRSLEHNSLGTQVNGSSWESWSIAQHWLSTSRGRNT